MDKEFGFNVKRERPEEEYEHVWDYFKGERLERYARSKGIQRIQTKIAARALELLDLPKKDALLLDAGCGPGFASFFLREMGYHVVSIDIISHFLYYYDFRDISRLVGDMCQLPFKPNMFDGGISISALQWIYRDIASERMESNLIDLLRSFYTVLKSGSKILFQFYPKNENVLINMKRIVNQYSKFGGGFHIDHPENPKKRRIFLELQKE